MLLDLPLWAIILISIGSLLCFFVIIKSTGIRILYSLSISLVITDVVLIVIHQFDIENGAIVQHEGDAYVAIFICLSILYYVGFVIYIIFKSVFKKRCCCHEKSNMDKIRDAYDGMTEAEKVNLYDELTNGIPKGKIYDTIEDDEIINEAEIFVDEEHGKVYNVIGEISPPVSGKNYDFRSIKGMLIK
jgi:hypothetical protein